MFSLFTNLLAQNIMENLYSSFHDLSKSIDLSIVSTLFLSWISLQFLVKRGADLFAENENKETPCDCAERQHHKELALGLESQMVFSTDPNAEDIEAEYAALDRREVSSLNKLWNFLWR